MINHQGFIGKNMDSIPGNRSFQYEEVKVVVNHVDIEVFVALSHRLDISIKEY